MLGEGSLDQDGVLGEGSLALEDPQLRARFGLRVRGFDLWGATVGTDQTGEHGCLFGGNIPGL